MTITWNQALAAAKAKAAEADYGSPFRYELTRLAPQLIRRYCPPRAAVLDIGCGSGRYALFFLEAGVQGSYTGIDISDERWIDLELPEEFPGRRIQLDAHELERLGEQFDFIISLTAFEHFADDKQVARGVAQVLKSGAQALIVVPAPWSFPLYGPHGYRRYTADNLYTLATEAGLEIVSLQKVGGLGGWLFHFHWFLPALLLRISIKALFIGLAVGDKNRAHRRWPRLFAWLDRLGNHHLRFPPGRWLHREGLRLASRIDPYLPILEVGWLAVMRKP